MKITSEGPPPNYLGRRFQLRMMMMVGLLVLVLAAIDRAREPSSWYWLTGPPRPESGSVVSPTIETTSHATATPEIIAAAVTIPPGILEKVSDDSVGLRSEEIGPYHQILAQARDVPNIYLETVARDAAFPVLQKQPDHFRGQVISIAGDLRRLMRFPIRENDQGITELYEALVFTSDSGTTAYRVRLTTPPGDLPVGRRIKPPIPVRLVGYFFKRDQYIVEKDLRVHSAPMLLAQRIDRRGTVSPGSNQLPTSDADRLWWALTLLGVVVGGASLTMLWTWRMRIGDRNFSTRGLKRATAAPEGAIESLEGVETVDPETFFQEMSDRESPSDQQQ